MLNVLQVCSDTNIGGAGKCILTYLKYCNRERLNISVVLPKDSLLKPKIQELGFNVIEIDGMADKSLDLKAVKKLLGVFRTFKPDIVHTHASMSARIAARLYGAKIVYTRHTVYPPSPKLTKGIGKLVSGTVNNITAHKIIAVAKAAKDNLTATGVSEKKIEIILNGVEPVKKASPEQIEKYRNEYGLSPDTKCTALIARLTEIKGHRYFIEAASILKEKGINARFFIAGTGEEEQAIRKQIAENNLEDYVTMLGFLEDVSPLVNIIDVQSNCSTTEAASLALLEGMSLGKPAVVSAAGGNPEVISDSKTGFVVPVGDSAAYAEKLIKLFTEPQLYDTMSQKSKTTFYNMFTAQKYAENIDNIYFSLGGKKNEKNKI